MREWCLTVVCSALVLGCCGAPRGPYDETVAKEYLKFVNAQDAAFSNEYSIAEWGYESNITDENLEVSVSFLPLL